jgi:hypothetical protein
VGYQLKESIAMYENKGDNEIRDIMDTNKPEMNSIRWKQ